MAKSELEGEKGKVWLSIESWCATHINQSKVISQFW